jgi:DNA replicative helicase MCM subunit Mcm2 (Cdc46/Mcm family)
MYSGSDLTTLMTQLASLTSSGFIQYDFFIGQMNPYLKIYVSNAQTAVFPVLTRLPNASKIIDLYYTTDFTPPVATFISDMTAGIKATVDSNAAALTAINTAFSHFSTFETTYNALG